ncbi:MAG: nitrous oxide reductase family maturation protein NosD [Planctomycetes bacterium]|nr:nitrous oxide reductase family maturation protein NosD [Planctomycetota bacterium]
MQSKKESLLVFSPLIGLALLAIAWAIPANSAQSVSERMAPLPPAPERPVHGIQVSNESELKRLLTEAPQGSTLLLDPGEYLGPIVIERGITVWGPPEAVIVTSGEGTTVRLHGIGSAAIGFSIQGSGSRYDLLDAALELQGEDLQAIGLHITEAVYGIIANRSKRIKLSENFVVGTGQDAMGLRGDGIRIWETYDSEISNNRMRGARDMVIWYSSGNRIIQNEVRGCRYGTHLMYSHDNRVIQNKYVNNVVGLFSMYTQRLHLEDNIFAASSGSAGIGLGMKESSDLRLINNLFIGNERGMYFDNSPFEKDTTIDIEGNQFYFSSVALDFHESPKNVILKNNLFRSNWSLISVSGRGDAMAVQTSGNDFDRYRGYDLDQDGYGDIPFEERSMSEQLISAHETLALFRGTPAAGMLEAIGQLLPLYQPTALLRDETPAMGKSNLELKSR